MGAGRREGMETRLRIGWSSILGTLSCASSCHMLLDICHSLCAYHDMVEPVVVVIMSASAYAGRSFARSTLVGRRCHVTPPSTAR